MEPYDRVTYTLFVCVSREGVYAGVAPRGGGGGGGIAPPWFSSVMYVDDNNTPSPLW